MRISDFGSVYIAAKIVVKMIFVCYRVVMESPNRVFPTTDLEIANRLVDQPSFPLIAD